MSVRTPPFTSSAAALVLAAALGGCGTAPPAVPGSEVCAGLVIAHAEADRDRRAARQAQEEAWRHAQAVQLVARYTEHKHAAGRAEVRMEQLRVEMDAQGCPPRGLG